MSKVYVLTATYCGDDSFTEGIFSSYAAMLTYLREKYEYTSEVTSLSDSECGVFVEQTNLGYSVAQWDLSYEAMNLAFQDGFDQGELNILRQFVQGKLDRDYILEMCGEQLGLGDEE